MKRTREEGAGAHKRGQHGDGPQCSNCFSTLSLAGLQSWKLQRSGKEQEETPCVSERGQCARRTLGTNETRGQTEDRSWRTQAKGKATVHFFFPRKLKTSERKLKKSEKQRFSPMVFEHCRKRLTGVRESLQQCSDVLGLRRYQMTEGKPGREFEEVLNFSSAAFSSAG